MEGGEPRRGTGHFVCSFGERKESKEMEDEKEQAP